MDIQTFASTVRSILDPAILVGNPIPLSACTLQKEYLLSKNGLSTDASVLMMAVPYYTTSCEEKHNISVYSIAEDYHLFFHQLFSHLIENLKLIDPNLVVAGFADHSPIKEVKAAALSGLGVLGKNHLLITDKYGSYVFLGELIINLPCQTIVPSEIPSCIGCNLCKSTCPVGGDMDQCLSALTQKKGQLTEEEEKRIQASPLIWGCDLCQVSCPLNKHKHYTDVDFFGHSPITMVTVEMLDEMNEETFAVRAFSWRGKDVIRRNLRIKQNKEEN